MPESLYALAILACPLGMGVMMWVMMRGKTSSAPTTEAKQDELSALRTEIDQLKASDKDRQSTRVEGL